MTQKHTNPRTNKHNCKKYLIDIKPIYKRNIKAQKFKQKSERGNKNQDKQEKDRLL